MNSFTYALEQRNLEILIFQVENGRLVQIVYLAIRF